MDNELEKQFFDTFGIESKDRFKGCKNGIDFYSYACEIPSCKGCPKEIRETSYPQITDHILLELICILNDLGASYLSYRFKRNINDLRQEILSDSIFSLIGENNASKEKLRHQVQALFKE